MTTDVTSRRAVVVGLGLIGGSVALALGEQGFTVFGIDRDEDRLRLALDRGVIAAIGDDLAAEIVVVCVPAGSVGPAVLEILARGGRNPSVIVTDVCGVKRPIVDSIDDPRFIGGHPMAGSEQLGLDGARADMFVGATWVLTPTATTDPARYAQLVAMVTRMGALALALDAADHDRLVAMVSHVPHLVAATLMHRATIGAASDGALLQLAAGGFRDMTRVAAGDPAIWPRICQANASAIDATLAEVIADLQELRSMIAEDRLDDLQGFLAGSSAARRALPAKTVQPTALATCRIPVPDRPGVLAEVTRIASDLGVNVVDLQIAHSVEGGLGVLQLTVDAARAHDLATAVVAREYRCSIEVL
jgi:prephenate dehydrogenase